MLVDELLTVATFGAFIAVWTTRADPGIALKLPVSVAVGCGIVQNLVVWTDYAVKMFIVDKLITLEKSPFCHGRFVWGRNVFTVILHFFTDPGRFVPRIHSHRFDFFKSLFYIIVNRIVSATLNRTEKCWTVYQRKVDDSGWANSTLCSPL